MPKFNRIRENIVKEKFVCKNCGIEKNETHYYFSRIQGQKYMEVCKDCFKQEFISSEDCFQVLKKYNIPFIRSLWDAINEDLPSYMRSINSLPQYRELQWKDSNLTSPEEENDENTEINFYDSIIENLKLEAQKLNNKLIFATNRDDMQLYISTIKSLRDTLDLINKYDWHLVYSSKILSCNDNKTLETIEISIWEENHEGTIRNKQTWTVVEPYKSVDRGLSLKH